MQRTIPIRPKRSIPKGGLKPDFLLFDDLVGPPVITPSGLNGSQFLIQQYTIKDPSGNYKPVQIVDGVVALLEGTAFSVQVTVLDPEVAVDPFDVSKLRFRWYRNGGYLYDTNNVNDFTGVNVIAFTEAQCVSEISGVYTLEVINGSGTTTSSELIIRVYNKVNVPELYGNLIQNSNGEAGLDNWDTANGITVAEYAADLVDVNSFGSISIRESLYTEADINRGGSTSEFPAVQPQKPFSFCKSSNWASLLTVKQSPSALTNFKWHYTYQTPNLISNEDAGGLDYGCFYPSKKFLDDYNGNAGKIGLTQDNKQIETYFTREPLPQNTNPVATMTQTIDVSNAADFIDGTVCGVDKLVGNFFTYVGVGVSSYQYEVEFEAVYRPGPADWGTYDGINQFFNQQITQNQVATFVGEELNNSPIANDDVKLYAPYDLFDTPGNNLPIFNFRDTSTQNNQRRELIYNQQVVRLYTNRNTITSVARYFDYSFPEWNIPIVGELLNESQLSRQKTDGTISSREGWSGFGNLFAHLFFKKSANLPNLSHPNQTSSNPTLRNEAFAYLSSSLNTRFRYAEQELFYRVVEPINQRYFGLSLDRPIMQFTNVNQQKQYDLLKTMAQFSVINSRREELSNEYITGANGFRRIPIPSIRKLYTSNPPTSGLITDLLNFYDAEQAQDALFTTNDSLKEGGTKSGDQGYLYLSRILTFHIYLKLLSGQINPQFQLVAPAAGSETLNTLMVDFENLKKVSSNGAITKRKLNGFVGGESRNVRRINIKPKCDDTVDFSFRYTNAFGDVIGEDALEGPNADDIFAVKEKVLLSWVIGKQLQRTCELPANKKITVTYNGGPALFALDNVNIYSPSINFINNTYVPEWRTEVAQTGRIFYEKGAAAFFGVSKKLYIPRGTRSIEVTAKFSNDSNALGLGADIGLNKYDSDLLRGEHTNFPPKFYSAGNPRVGLAHVKLCLYDDEFKRTAKYPHYYIPRYHIWSELKKLNYINPNAYFEGGRSVGDGGDITFGYYNYDPPTRGTIETLNAVARASATGSNVISRGLPPNPTYPK